MQFTLHTTFKSGRQDVQCLTATDRADARTHVRELVESNRNVAKASVSDLQYKKSGWNYEIKAAV
jgi:hypothetical protein